MFFARVFFRFDAAFCKTMRRAKDFARLTMNLFFLRPKSAVAPNAQISSFLCEVRNKLADVRTQDKSRAHFYQRECDRSCGKPKRFR